MDRTEGLLMRRVGQLQMLGAEKEAIRKQPKHQLRSGRGCEQVPAVTANLSDPFVLNKLAKETREALERRRCARAQQRRDG